MFHGLVARCAIERLDDSRATEVELSVAPDLAVAVDADAVERTMLNLVSNALADACGKVFVSASVTGGTLALVVRDDGEGIAPEPLSRLGERFFRSDESRSRRRGGVGLGLAIVKSLAESNGGDLRIESRLGEGTTAYVRFRIDGKPGSSRFWEKAK